MLTLITQRAQHWFTPVASTSRIVELDALRGLAALAVVFYHYTRRYDQIYGHTSGLPFQVAVGQYGVQLFFIISGFVILMSLEHTKRVQDFIVKRLVRLYPTYWMAIALTFSLVALFGLPGREVSLYHALLNGVMVHAFWQIPNVDGVYWTLFHECIFYVVMVGIFVMRLLPHIEWVGAAWLSIITLEQHDLLIEIPESLEPWFLIEYGYLFIMGIVLYRIHTRGASVLRYNLLAACFASQVAYYPEVERHLMVMGFIMAFSLIKTGHLRAIAIPPLLALGTLSYPLYLTHQNIGYIIIRALEGGGLSPSVSIVIAMSAAIAIALLITRYVEQPTLLWLKQHYRRRPWALKHKSEGV
ncbi:MAG: acyltransferase [Leptolyngbyaceae bacterium]|nr:acyltransferase [Leptolyngbyaceae bacterium]